MTIVEAIKQVTSGKDLNSEEMLSVMNVIMSGQSTDAQNAAFLVGLQMKGVCTAEVLGGATVMRALSAKVEVENSPHLVDTCGTCLLYTSPSPRDLSTSRMPSSA